MDETTRRHDLSRLLMGLAILALGVVFTLDHMDWLDAGSLFDYWPLFLVAIGLSRLLQAPGGKGRGFGLFLVVVGGWWLLYNLEIVDVNIWQVWPVLLVLGGAIMIMKALGLAGERRARPVSFETSVAGADPMAPPPPPSGGEAYLPAPAASSDDYVDGIALLGGFKRVVTSKQFRGGSLTAFMGGCEVDLRQAAIAGDRAVIDALAFWGGVDIRVPADWAVELQGTPILGGFEDKTRQRHGSSAKTLVVKGFAVMGGVEVKD